MHDGSEATSFVFSDAGLHGVYADARQAVAAAVALLRGRDDARCALHAGPIERRGGEIHGMAVNRAMRLLAIAQPGQGLLSEAFAALAARSLPADAALLELGVVRLADLCRAERIYQLSAPGLRRDFPPPRSLDDTPNNLPESLCSFIGRGREIGEIRKLLGQNRLLTLLGMGGVGKTRLALHAAAESLPEYSEGAWLVELGPLHEGREVMRAVAAALGVRADEGQRLGAAVADHIAQGRRLLILDNCEHVIEGAALAARRLLIECSGLRVLATSREPLRIPREALFLVPGLSVPIAGRRNPATGYFAARLFADRARAVAPGFNLAAANSGSVARICRHLDGIPLAIELAAARAGSMPLHEIAVGIESRLAARTGSVPAPPRETILRHMIEWSHEHLQRDERVVLRRLAVFAGGFRREDALEVCALGALDRAAVAKALHALAHASLVMPEPGDERLRTAEAVREYAHERLAEAGEMQALGDRHLEQFVRFAREARTGLGGPDQATWLARLDAERHNLLAAHQWAGSRPELAIAGLRLANALKLYWMNRGLPREGLALIHDALDRSGLGAAEADRAQALFNTGQIRYFLGRHGEARQDLAASLAIARRLGPAYVAAVLQPLGMAALADGEVVLARQCFQEGVSLARESGDKRSLAGALNALAMSHRVGGNARRARQLHEEVVRLAHEIGDGEVEAIGLVNLAMTLIDEGAREEPLEPVEHALRLAAATGSALAAQSLLDVCAALASRRGDWRRAARYYGTAEAQARRSGLRRDAADARFLEPHVAAARAAAGEEAFRAAQADGARCDAQQALREAAAWLRPASPAAKPARESVTASR
ncbi:MAG TPA: AAA family ATPase [Usitatibacter sp.]|nr:AAA family ATPase [Usitatibacter sp.]